MKICTGPTAQFIAAYAPTSASLVCFSGDWMQNTRYERLYCSCGRAGILYLPVFQQQALIDTY